MTHSAVRNHRCHNDHGKLNAETLKHWSFRSYLSEQKKAYSSAFVFHAEKKTDNKIFKQIVSQSTLALVLRVYVYVTYLSFHKNLVGFYRNPQTTRREAICLWFGVGAVFIVDCLFDWLSVRKTFYEEEYKTNCSKHQQHCKALTESLSLIHLIIMRLASERAS